MAGERGRIDGFARGVLLLGSVLLAACSGAAKTAPGKACLVNSDCTNPLSCSYGKCHATCAEARDCPTDQLCVKAPVGAVCQLPTEVLCHYRSECLDPLTCALDRHCRSQCLKDIDCPTSTQKCVLPDKVCAEPSEIDTTGKLKSAQDTPVPDSPDAGATDGGGGGGGGAAGNNGMDGSSTGGSSADAGPDAPVMITCPGQALTTFGKIATGDSNAGYTSGLGVRTATEFLIFSGYTGPDTSSDAAAPATINRIDVQHFDLTGKSTKAAAPLFMAPGNTSIYVNSVAIAPGGQIALVYSVTRAGTSYAAVYVSFLNIDLTGDPPTQLEAFNGSRWGIQGHVQWEDGQFVASWVSYPGAGPYVKMAKFGFDGTISGSSGTVPNDDPSGVVYASNLEMGGVAFSQGIFAVSYANSSNSFATLAFLDELDGNPVRAPLFLPFALAGSRFVTVGATPQGFVSVYSGKLTEADGGVVNPESVLATFVSSSPDGGVGTTFAPPGGAAYSDQNAVRATSDSLGAGFVLHYPDGTARFLYISGDGSKHLGPQTIISQQDPASVADEVHITSFGGSFALSLYSGAEHLTRMAASGCPPQRVDAGP